MSIEDSLLRWEGIDPAKVDEIAANIVHVLDVAKSQIENVKLIMDEATKLIAVVEAELPRVQKIGADVRSQITAYEANQKRYR